MARPKLPEGERRRRLELHLREGDRRLLVLLTEMEGGNQSAAVRRAVDLYCLRVEALEHFENLQPKVPK